MSCLKRLNFFRGAALLSFLDLLSSLLLSLVFLFTYQQHMLIYSLQRQAIVLHSQHQHGTNGLELEHIRTKLKRVR